MTPERVAAAAIAGALCYYPQSVSCQALCEDCRREGVHAVERLSAAGLVITTAERMAALLDELRALAAERAELRDLFTRAATACERAEAEAQRFQAAERCRTRQRDEALAEREKLLAEVARARTWFREAAEEVIGCHEALGLNWCGFLLPERAALSGSAGA